MENLINLVPDKTIELLEKKGLSKKDLIDKLEEFLKESTNLGHSEKLHKTYIGNRINSYIMTFLHSEKVLVKAIVLGLGRLEENNAKWRGFSEKNKGKEINVCTSTKHVVPINEKGKYVSKEGYFHAGFKQGLPIPNEEDWQQTGFIEIEYKDKMYFKNCTFQGDWLNEPELHNAVSGNVIQISIDPTYLNSKTVYISKYEKKAILDEKDYLKLINEELSECVTTIEKLSQIPNLANTFCIIKGNVGDFQGNSFTFTDENLQMDNFDVSMHIQAFLKNIPFVAGALGITFIGEAYKKTDGSGIGMFIYKALTPDVYKRKKISKTEVDEITNNNIDDQLLEDVEEIDITNEDL